MYEIWTDNQYPTEWSSSMVNEVRDKIAKIEKVTSKATTKQQHLKKTKSLKQNGCKPIILLFNKDETSIKLRRGE